MFFRLFFIHIFVYIYIFKVALVKKKLQTIIYINNYIHLETAENWIFKMWELVFNDCLLRKI